jgi:hypothetical protein
MDEIVKDCIGVKVILKSNGTNYLEKFYNWWWCYFRMIVSRAISSISPDTTIYERENGAID